MLSSSMFELDIYFINLILVMVVEILVLLQRCSEVIPGLCLGLISDCALGTICGSGGLIWGLMND